MRYFVFPIITLFILSVWCIPSFAQTTPTAPNITVTKDKSSYTIGDTIVISGAVKAVVIGTPLTIQILDPSNTIVQIAQIDVSQDGKYAKSILASGPLWKASGTYTVKVQYGPSVTAQTTFTFARSTIPISNYFIVKDPSSQQTFSVNYTITGGTVKDMTIDTQSISLITSLNSTSCNINCGITLQIPRSLIDAKTSNGQDDSFIVLIDGAEVKPSGEETNNSFRTLTIQFLQGDQDVEIIGTQIVPEFGTIAALVLAIAIISIIAVSAKTGLRFMPKY
ncbi:MAG TPA: PEFG-CTERM sorting domain-containing protein [Nitrosopumilaceae archaeon]|nr:PEFG-CTERM sorting domain-containing protein [Nitrosopumilaceae archaeon]